MKKSLTFSLIGFVFLIGCVLAGAKVSSASNADLKNFTSNITTCAVITYNLQVGSKDVTTNGEVSKLQLYLISKGYLNSEPTGYYGILTKNAVKNFQTVNGIYELGVGPITRVYIAIHSCGQTPIATLTANGSHEITINSDNNVSLAWSSANGTAYSSVSVAGFSSQTGEPCQNVIPGIDTASGTETLGGFQAYCNYEITYTVVGDGENATDKVTVHVNPLSSKTYNLNVTVVGSGVVSSLPVGIDCGKICSQSFNYGTLVTLRVKPISGSFVNWSGACTGTEFYCTVTMSEAKSVTANFSLGYPPPSAILTANGSKTVTLSVGNTVTFQWSSKYGVQYSSSYTSSNNNSCGSSDEWIVKTNVGAITTPILTTDAGCTYTFNYHVVGVGGNADSQVTVIINPSPTYNLTVTKSGLGTVTTNPTGITCGSTCTKSFNSGTVVTLTQVPITGNYFTGWSGACIGSGKTCVVTMSSAKTVKASFDSSVPTASLTVNGVHSVTVDVGAKLNYVWSSTHGAIFSSDYTSPTCGSGNWVATTSSGSSSGTIVDSQANCTYKITYHVVGAKANADDTITVKVNPKKVSFVGDTSQVANVLNAMNDVLSKQSTLQASTVSSLLDFLMGNLGKVLNR